MGNTMSADITCDSSNFVQNGAIGTPFPGGYIAPVTGLLMNAVCGAGVSGMSPYSESKQSSWYNCALSCDLDATCLTLVFEPSTGSCKQYSDSFYTNNNVQTVQPATTQLMYYATTKQTSCVQGSVNGYTIECGIDYAGGDIGAQYGTTFTQCMAFCDQTSGCIDVAFNNGACYMKGSLGQRVTNPNVRTARKTSYVPGPSCVNNLSDGTTFNGFDILCGVDYAGNDIGSTNTPTFQKCIETCSQTSGCVDVSYNGNGCYMKGKLGQLNQNGGVWTARKSGTTVPTPYTGPTCVDNASDGKTFTSNSNNDYKIICGSEHAGGDVASQQADTFADCIAACDSTTGCIDVSYVGKNCYMKNQLTPLVQAPGVWTAVRSSAVASTPQDNLSCQNNRDNLKQYTAPSQQLFVVECGADYFGGDLSSLNTPTFQACVNQCDSTQGCVAVAYRGTGCYLKNEKKDTKTDSGVWGARIIQGASGTTTTTTTATTTTTTTTQSIPTETV